MNTTLHEPRASLSLAQRRARAANLALIEQRIANARAMQGQGLTPDPAPGELGPEAWAGLFNAGLILITVVLIVVAALKVLP